MDIQMPVMDGLEATRRIRTLVATPGGERFATLPIIAMTALAMAGDAEKTRAAGMNDHVTKPVNPELLMAALGRWARRPAAGTIAVTGAGGDSAPLDDLPSLDTRAGVRRIGGKVAAYRRQLARFRARYAGAVDELERQLAAEGVAAAEAYCHAALKGVAGNLRAQDLYQQIAAIDADLKEGQPPAAAALAALRARLAEVLADIDRLAAAESADTSGEAARDTGPPP